MYISISIFTIMQYVVIKLMVITVSPVKLDCWHLLIKFVEVQNIKMSDSKQSYVISLEV